MAEAPRETPEQRIARQLDTSLALARNGDWTEAMKLFRQTAESKGVDEDLRDRYADAIIDEMSGIVSKKGTEKRIGKVSPLQVDEIMVPVGMQFAILEFAERAGKPIYGQQLMDSGIVQGTAYITLRRMTEKGYFRRYEDPDHSGSGIARRYYELTPTGEKALRLARAVATAASGIFGSSEKKK